ncbi:hypothetical protein BpHYR1_001375 [Brachionus plicatilis]|uniref:Uncharacterized protein n=1 Tax=Brachionus plicatilis TaxID=10195 RepID=A0A3M7PDI4_BRAPC|nr:hypothetical protein BpHYR1_001375 [Brachionus plicatilis]
MTLSPNSNLPKLILNYLKNCEKKSLLICFDWELIAKNLTRIHCFYRKPRIAKFKLFSNQFIFNS